jgi:hypothetical protein
MERFLPEYKGLHWKQEPVFASRLLPEQFLLLFPVLSEPVEKKQCDFFNSHIDGSFQVTGNLP